MFKRKKKVELKPCPFCGGEVKRHEGIVKGIVMFTCYNCGADVCFYGAEFEPKASMVWNRRAMESVMADLKIKAENLEINNQILRDKLAEAELQR